MTEFSLSGTTQTGSAVGNNFYLDLLGPECSFSRMTWTAIPILTGFFYGHHCFQNSLQQLTKLYWWIITPGRVILEGLHICRSIRSSSKLLSAQNCYCSYICKIALFYIVCKFLTIPFNLLQDKQSLKTILQSTRFCWIKIDQIQLNSKIFMPLLNKRSILIPCSNTVSLVYLSHSNKTI